MPLNIFDNRTQLRSLELAEEYNLEKDHSMS